MAENMTLRPEQEAALRYAQAKGTEAPLASIRKRCAGTFAQIEELLASLPEEIVRVQPGTGRWSVQEVVDHLIESHRPAVEQLRSLIAGIPPAGDPIPASLQSADPLGQPWSDLVRRLQAIHRDYLGALDSASDNTPVDVKTPVLMVVKAKEDDGRTVPVEWLHDFDWKAYAVIFRSHTLEHIAQIERTLAAVSAQ